MLDSKVGSDSLSPCNRYIWRSRGDRVQQRENWDLWPESKLTRSNWANFSWLVGKLLCPMELSRSVNLRVLQLLNYSCALFCWAHSQLTFHVIFILKLPLLQPAQLQTKTCPLKTEFELFCCKLALLERAINLFTGAWVTQLACTSPQYSQSTRISLLCRSNKKNFSLVTPKLTLFQKFEKQ